MLRYDVVVVVVVVVIVIVIIVVVALVAADFFLCQDFTSTSKLAIFTEKQRQRQHRNSQVR